MLNILSLIEVCRKALKLLDAAVSSNQQQRSPAVWFRMLTLLASWGLAECDLPVTIGYSIMALSKTKRMGTYDVGCKQELQWLEFSYSYKEWSYVSSHIPSPNKRLLLLSYDAGAEIPKETLINYLCPARSCSFLSSFLLLHVLSSSPSTSSKIYSSDEEIFFSVFQVLDHIRQYKWR